MDFRTILYMSILLAQVPGTALAQRQVQLAPLTLPINSLGAAEQRLAELDSLVSAADRAGASLSLNRNQQMAAAGLQTMLATNPDSREAAQAWRDLVSSFGAGGTDINALLQWVLRESYLEMVSDLRDMVEKVKYFNETKKAIRDELQRIDSHPCRPPECQPFQTNASRLWTSFGSAFLTRPEQLAAYRGELVSQESAADREGQAMQINLQNEMHRQTAAYELLNNVTRRMHDAAIAAIQNVR